MKLFLLFTLIFQLNCALAQQSYFTPETKAMGLQFYQDKLYRGCSDLKEKQDPVPQDELALIISFARKQVEKNFSKAFDENPKVKAAFERDMNTILEDRSCKLPGNHCRARLLALSIYYIQPFRIDIPQCRVKPFAAASKEECEIETKYRTRDLTLVYGSNYGRPGPQTYKKQLVKLKNDLVSDLFTLIMQKDQKTIYICNNVQSGLVHRYALELNETGEYYVGLDPDLTPEKTFIKECKEESHFLFGEFVRGYFDEDRSSLGQDQIEPLKTRITQYLKAHPEEVVTHVEVTSSSSKTPFYTIIAGKKVIDPDSDTRNLQIATERAMFAKKVFNDMKTSSVKYGSITFSVRAELAGPDFSPTDLNERFVTKMSGGYLEKIDQLFQKNEKLYKEKAFMGSSAELLNEKEFVNLYQAKFKPFHGFSLVFRGYKTDEAKCQDLDPGSGKKIRSSRQ